MHFHSKQNHIIDFLFPVALFFVFAVSALTILLLASNIYRSATDHSSLNYTARTSLSYISEKVHQSDEAGTVSLEKFDGCDALVIDHAYEGETYRTYIYVYEQELRELLTKSGTAVSAASGRPILQVEDFSMEQIKDGLFRLTCTDAAGQKASTLVSLHTQ